MVNASDSQSDGNGVSAPSLTGSSPVTDTKQKLKFTKEVKRLELIPTTVSTIKRWRFCLSIVAHLRHLNNGEDSPDGYVCVTKCDAEKLGEDRGQQIRLIFL
jgi:hypothetical protein